MEREQMIERIVVTIIGTHLECVLNRKDPKYSACAICKYKDGNWCFLEQKIAESIYDLIIHDGAVVLTREEYADLRTLSDCAVCEHKEIEQARKETAREIYLQVKEKSWSTLYLPICDEEETDWATREVLDLLKTTIKNICGVEVEE